MRLPWRRRGDRAPLARRVRRDDDPEAAASAPRSASSSGEFTAELLEIAAPRRLHLLRPLARARAGVALGRGRSQHGAGAGRGSRSATPSGSPPAASRSSRGRPRDPAPLRRRVLRLGLPRQLAHVRAHPRRARPPAPQGEARRPDRRRRLAHRPRAPPPRRLPRRHRAGRGRAGTASSSSTRATRTSSGRCAFGNDASKARSTPTSAGGEKYRFAIESATFREILRARCRRRTWRSRAEGSKRGIEATGTRSGPSAAVTSSSSPPRNGAEAGTVSGREAVPGTVRAVEGILARRSASKSTS